MASLRRRLLAAGVVASLCFLAPSTYADDAPVGRWRELIAAASRTFSIPESWISSVMRAESAGKENVGGKPITSPAGAMGLMQIMPETWEGLRSRYGLGIDPYDAHDNIFAGAAYLRELYQQYGYPDLFAAYNAGPGRLNSYLEGSRQLPAETSDYLAKLGVRPGAPTSVGRGLFFALSHGGLDHLAPAAGSLFISLRTGPHSP